MKLTQPFVRLPYQFDVERLRTELAQFTEHDWMPHPSGIVGNIAIPLISHGGGDNNDFSGKMQPTPHLQQCGYMQQVMASFDEVLARSRLMRLNAGAEVTAHVDFNYHWYSRVRIHIPLITTPEVRFFCGEEDIHMAAGECWIFDSWRWHNVVNNGEHDRVHLVIDTAGSSKFWRMVEEICAGQTQNETTVAYDPEAVVQLKTEHFNVSPVMAPGELEALAQELIADVRNNPQNDADVVTEYSALLRDLAKDWRSIWLQFGISSEGFSHYRNLLDQTVARLRPHPRALVTASNNVGVNPIIMQRIVRAALNEELIAEFIRVDSN